MFGFCNEIVCATYFEFSEHGDKTHSQILIKLQNKHLILTKNRLFLHEKNSLNTKLIFDVSLVSGKDVSL